MILALSQLAWANCSLQALDAELQAATLAATDGRLDRRRRRVILDQLACTTDPIDPARAAQVHTVLGLYEQQRGDLDLAARHVYAAWEAAPLVEPTVELDTDLRRASVQVQEQQFQATRSVTPLPAAPMRRVDGLPAAWRTTDIPALVQIDGMGAELVSPARGGATATAPQSGPKIPLLIAGIASGVLAGGLYGGAWAARGQYEQAVSSGADDASRQSAHSLNRGLSVASVGALGLGGVLVGLSF